MAIVGPSGIGKSTLAALITGLLEPTSGSVLVGGVPASQVDPAARVLIPQEAYVFRGTLLENLTYLADAPMAAVEAAVEAVGAGEVVRLTDGYDTEFDPGVLSAPRRDRPSHRLRAPRPASAAHGRNPRAARRQHDQKQIDRAVRAQ